MKKVLLSLAISVMALGVSPSIGAFEGTFDLSPSACKEVVSHYMSKRLTDPRSAKVQLKGEPYKVRVDMRSAENIPAWAVDVKVKSRLPNGSWSNYQPYTVLFQKGQAVALKGDVADITRI